MRRLSVLVGVWALSLVAFGLEPHGSWAAPAQLPLVPYPRQVVIGEGVFDCGTNAVKLAFATVTRDASLPAEGYRLSVTPTAIRVTAADAAGEFYAGVTLGQLETVVGGRHLVTAAEIEDAPAYRWRGLHLDVSRHFFGVPTIKRYLDAMAEHKLNVFHWHLVDDQGWRLELEGFPQLTRVGARRPSTPSVHDDAVADGVPYGPYFYTREEVREVLAYAAARHIRVVPEIEIPGHSWALLAAYPELGCPNAERYTAACDGWGIFKGVVCAGNPDTYRMLERILDQVCEIFPSEIIHIGGDEAPKDNWKACELCQARMRELKLADEDQLQASMTRHFVDYLAKTGRRAIGWDEIMKGGLPGGALVMSWNGKAGGMAAAQDGHDVVMVPSDSCYLDMSQGLGMDDPFEYPPCSWGHVTTLERVYRFDPAEGIGPEARAHVLGGQANLWTERIWSETELFWKAYPRACALAEVLWTADPERRYADFLGRMRIHRGRLFERGIPCAPTGGR